MIDVVHNSERLLLRRGYKIRSPRAVEKTIHAFMKQKQPRGLRVRYAIDKPTNYLHLETRTALAMDAIVTHLRTNRMLIERVQPKDLQ